MSSAAELAVPEKPVVNPASALAPERRRPADISIAAVSATPPWPSGGGSRVWEASALRSCWLADAAAETSAARAANTVPRRITGRSGQPIN